MKKRLSFITALAVVCTFFVGCKKDKEEPIDILTSKTWKRAAVDKNPSTNPKGSIKYFEISGCVKDDVFYFYDNGTYEIKNPDGTCSTQMSGFKISKYNLNSNEFYLGNSTVGEIAEISKKQLKIYFKIVVSQSPDPNMPDYLVMILE